jgi:predicted phosphodiesterase
VLEHAQKQNVDQIIIAGDLINIIPNSRACWDLVKSLNLRLLRGNHERYIYHYNTLHAHPDWYKENFQGLPFVVYQFTLEERQAMSELPLHLHFDNLLITHATYRADGESFSAETSSHQLEEMFAGSTEAFILRGHNHRSFSAKFNNRIIESMGSVGLPLDGTPEAKYSIAEKYGNTWTFYRHAVPYDREATIKHFIDSGYLEEGRAIAKITLAELRTSRGHLIEFLSDYKHWSQNETLTMTQAADAFLASQ